MRSSSIDRRHTPITGPPVQEVMCHDCATQEEDDDAFSDMDDDTLSDMDESEDLIVTVIPLEKRRKRSQTTTTKPSTPERTAIQMAANILRSMEPEHGSGSCSSKSTFVRHTGGQADGSVDQAASRSMAMGDDIESSSDEGPPPR